MRRPRCRCTWGRSILRLCLTEIYRLRLGALRDVANTLGAASEFGLLEAYRRPAAAIGRVSTLYLYLIEIYYSRHGAASHKILQVCGRPSPNWGHRGGVSSPCFRYPGGVRVNMRSNDKYVPILSLPIR